MTLLALMGLLAPFLAPFDPLQQDLPSRLLPPAWGPGGDLGHPLGTDALGRDLLSRIMFGARASLFVPAAALIVALGLGTTLGLCAGYFGGLVDAIIMRLVDVQLAFPFLLLAIAVMAVIQPSVGAVVLVLGVTGWVIYARVLRGQTLGLRSQEFVLAAQTIGAPASRIIIRHLLPNVLPTMIVLGTLQAAQFIIAESALSFLGLGIPASSPSWGSIMNDGQDYLTSAWWIITLPGTFIVIAVMALGILGDWARDVLDPRLRNV